MQDLRRQLKEAINAEKNWERYIKEAKKNLEAASSHRRNIEREMREYVDPRYDGWTYDMWLEKIISNNLDCPYEDAILYWERTFMQGVKSTMDIKKAISDKYALAKTEEERNLLRKHCGYC